MEFAVFGLLNTSTEAKVILSSVFVSWSLLDGHNSYLNLHKVFKVSSVFAAN